MAVVLKNAARGTGQLALGIILALLVPLAVAFNIDFIADRAIVINETTHLMDGPSGAANVIATISKGHQVKITPYDDVWSSVEWEDKVYFVRQSKIKKII